MDMIAYRWRSVQGADRASSQKFPNLKLVFILTFYSIVLKWGAKSGKGERTMSKNRRLIAAVICVVAVLSMFASSAYIVHEAAHHHECTGEDCPICRFIAQVEQVRRGFGMVLLALLLIRFALALRREAHAPVAADAPALCTLVGRKVRLND